MSSSVTAVTVCTAARVAPAGRDRANAGGRVSIGTVTATVRAALGGPAPPDGPGSPTFMPAG